MTGDGAMFGKRAMRRPARPAGELPGEAPPGRAAAAARPRAGRARRRRVVLAAVIGLTALLGHAPSHVSPRAAELVMFESAGCEWCATWDREVGIVYHKTAEGQRAPLRRVDKAAPRPADLTGVDGIVYTPTFVLMDGGSEIGRILGYPGESHFWGLLGVLLEKLPARAGS
jgi:hypothetical protein